MTIGTRMPAARRRMGFTQRQLAEAAGFTHRYIAALESGEVSSPGIKACLRISKALATTVSELCGEVIPQLTKQERAVLAALRNNGE